MSEQKTENLTIEGIVAKIAELETEGKTEKEITKELEEWIDLNFELSTYVPIREKYSVAELLYAVIISDRDLSLEETTELFVEYEYKKQFNMICEYLNLPFDIWDMNESNYDILSRYHIINLVKSKVGSDYDVFSKLIDNYVGIGCYNITREINLVLGDLPTQKSLKEVVSAFENKEDLVQKLNEIEAFNTPHLAEIRAELEKVALDSVMSNTPTEE